MKEQENSENENPNWKVWIPIYGLYQTIKDTWDGKPSLVYENNNETKFIAYGIYHGVIGALLASIGLVGLEKLLQ